jgi:hypothetical protein
MKSKAKRTDDTNGKRKYQRTGRSYQAQQHCRLSLRQGGTLLVILFTNEIAKQAEIGTRVDLLFDHAELTIVPDDDGHFIVRKQKSGNITYPHVVVPVGPGKPFSCSFSEQGSIICEHEVDEHKLVLLLPDGVELTDNGNQAE